MRRLRPKLSYGNVMASIAVFAVLGGGVAWAHGKIGTADLKNNAVTAPKIKKNAVKRAKLTHALKPRYAVVQHNGDLVRGKGAVDSETVAAFTYDVTFNRNVSNCGYSATITEITGGDDLGFISARPGNDPEVVHVETRDEDGVGAPRSFHLVTTC